MQISVGKNHGSSVCGQMIFKIKIFWRTLEWADMKWSDIIRADIIMSATGPSAQIMSDQITSDKVSLLIWNCNKYKLHNYIISEKYEIVFMNM